MTDRQINQSRAFKRILAHVTEIGKEVVTPNAFSVDSDARFPHEAFAALKAEGLMSAYVPEEFGGLNLTITQVGELCYVLGQHCGSTAMNFAMHHVLVACMVHHHDSSDYFQKYLGNLCKEQWLIASGHSEIGTAGDLAISKCALESTESGFSITKEAPYITYGEQADSIVLTCRSGPEATERDQAQVVLNRGDYTLDQFSDWDAMGMRGTCTAGFTVTAKGNNEQVFPVPFTDILKMTMAPVAHILWGFLWAGIAADAFEKARTVATAQTRKNPGKQPIAVTRLSEAGTELFLIRNSLQQFALEYENKLATNNISEFDGIEFALRLNNLKVTCSEKALAVITKALMICGIVSYKNDTELSLSRHIRDIYSAPLMINNDRILGNCGILLTSHEE